MGHFQEGFSMARKIAVIPGDGIGPEVIRPAVDVLKHLQPGFELDMFDLGAERYLKDGTTMPPELMASLKDGVYDAVLLGALGDPRVPGNEPAHDILLGCRFGLDLFVNHRPVRLLVPRYSPLKTASGIDMTIFRENTEGEYVGMGGTMRKGLPDEIATELSVATRHGVVRIIEYAFMWAQQNGKRRVCCATKANAQPETGGVWMRAFRDISARYPRIDARHMYIDAVAAQMVLHPEDFDVIVTSNLFGDIITDLGAAIAGSMGLAASGNINPAGIGLFEPVHGSAPDIAGKGIANPMAAILSVGMMFAHMKLPELAEKVENAVTACLEESIVTQDLSGTYTTVEVGNAVLQKLVE